jgi:predicted NBD/HSP70 family sugar kinase
MITSHQKRLIRVMRVIRKHPGIVRPELAERLGIKQSTVSGLITELVRLGLIQKAGKLASNGGRPANRLELVPSSACAMGLVLTTRSLEGVLLDISGRIIERTSSRLPQWQPEAMLDSLQKVAGQLSQNHPDLRLLGLGVGIAGVVGRQSGISREFPNVPEWRDVNIKAELESRLELEVEVDNAVRAATLAELRYGAGRGVRDFLYLHVGRGIALGTVIGSQVHSGASRSAGELGHFQVDPEGPVCYCGSTGCLESVAAPTALLRDAAKAVRHGVKTSLAACSDDPANLCAEDLFAAAAQGDRLARNMVERAGQAIGRITAGIDNVLNPEMLIFGGLLAGEASALRESIESNHRALVMPIAENTTEFRLAELGSSASVVGAATLVFERAFSADEWLLSRLAGQVTLKSE